MEGIFKGLLAAAFRIFVIVQICVRWPLCDGWFHVMMGPKGL